MIQLTSIALVSEAAVAVVADGADVRGETALATSGGAEPPHLRGEAAETAAGSAAAAMRVAAAVA